MAKRNAKKGAGVLIDVEWITDCGLQGLFRQELHVFQGEEKPKQVMVSVTDYDFWDSAFVEITLYPSAFDGRWVKLFVPRNHVHGIVETQSIEDATKVGFVVAGELQRSKKQRSAKLSSLKRAGT